VPNQQHQTPLKYENKRQNKLKKSKGKPDWEIPQMCPEISAIGIPMDARSLKQKIPEETMVLLKVKQRNGY